MKREDFLEKKNTINWKYLAYIMQLESSANLKNMYQTGFIPLNKSREY